MSILPSILRQAPTSLSGWRLLELGGAVYLRSVRAMASSTARGAQTVDEIMLPDSLRLMVSSSDRQLEATARFVHVPAPGPCRTRSGVSPDPWIQQFARALLRWLLPWHQWCVC